MGCGQPPAGRRSDPTADEALMDLFLAENEDKKLRITSPRSPPGTGTAEGSLLMEVAPTNPAFFPSSIGDPGFGNIPPLPVTGTFPAPSDFDPWAAVVENMNVANIDQPSIVPESPLNLMEFPADSLDLGDPLTQLSYGQPMVPVPETRGLHGPTDMNRELHGWLAI